MPTTTVKSPDDDGEIAEVAEKFANDERNEIAHTFSGAFPTRLGIEWSEYF